MTMSRTNATERCSGMSRRDQLLDACIDGLADGLRSHVPGAVGIVLKTAALCVSLTLAHILLGIPLAIGGLGAGAGTLLHASTRPTLPP
jgi:hypothetical protein